MRYRESVGACESRGADINLAAHTNLSCASGSEDGRVAVKIGAIGSNEKPRHYESTENKSAGEQLDKKKEKKEIDATCTKENSVE